MQSAIMSKAAVPLLCIGGVVGVVILKSGFIFLLLALLPAVIAYYVDHSESKAVFKTVFACNLAATLPSLMPMLKAGLAMKDFNVAAIMGNPSVWLFVYSGAAAGWCLVFLCRLIARLFIILLYEYRVAALEKSQQRLVEEWGKELQKKSGG